MTLRENHAAFITLRENGHAASAVANRHDVGLVTHSVSIAAVVSDTEVMKSLCCP
jgi:hypothetical protein